MTLIKDRDRCRYSSRLDALIIFNTSVQKIENPDQLTAAEMPTETGNETNGRLYLERDFSRLCLMDCYSIHS